MSSADSTDYNVHDSDVVFGSIHLYLSFTEKMSDYLTIADLKKLYLVTFDARIKWRNILLILDVPSDTIDSIGTKWRDDPDECYREGLKEWLKGEERSWEDVVKALSSPIVGHVHIANTIEKDHLQSTDASNPTDVKSEGKH